MWIGVTSMGGRIGMLARNQSAAQAEVGYAASIRCERAFVNGRVQALGADPRRLSRPEVPVRPASSSPGVTVSERALRLAPTLATPTRTMADDLYRSEDLRQEDETDERRDRGLEAHQDAVRGAPHARRATISSVPRDELLNTATMKTQPQVAGRRHEHAEVTEDEAEGDGERGADDESGREAAAVRPVTGHAAPTRMYSSPAAARRERRRRPPAYRRRPRCRRPGCRCPPPPEHGPQEIQGRREPRTATASGPQNSIVTATPSGMRLIAK